MQRNCNTVINILSSFVSNLVRSSGKPDPSIVKGDDKLSLVQLHVDLPASEQYQRVDGHHAAVPDEDAARFHLLVVNKVGAGVVAGLWHKGKVRHNVFLNTGSKVASHLHHPTM